VQWKTILDDLLAKQRSEECRSTGGLPNQASTAGKQPDE
jgi:hypothetical protein